MALPLIRHSIRRKDLDFLLESVLQDRLVSGVFSERLSREISQSFRAQGTELFASPSIAVSAVVRSLRLQAGDRVLLSVLAPPYWAVGLQDVGVECIWSDVDSDSPVLSAASLPAGDVLAGCRAVIADTTLCYIPDFVQLKQLGLPLVCDISQGLGGCWQEIPVGHFGDITFASFGSDSLLAGPGGCAVAFRNGNRAEGLAWDRMSDVVASLLLSQWADVSALAEGKQANFGILFQWLARSFRQPKQIGNASPAGPYFCVLADSGAKEILAFARRNAVEADWAFRDFAAEAVALREDEFPHGRRFLQHTLAFPLYSTFGAKELENLGRVMASLP